MKKKINSNDNISVSKPLLAQTAVINWVAVKDKKPPKNTWLLLGNSKDKWTDRGELSDIGFYYNGEGCEIYPTHWAKMPKPPCL